MQQPIAIYTRAETLIRAYTSTTYIWLLHSAPTSAQDSLGPLQLALVMFSYHQLPQKHNLHLWWYIIYNMLWTCTCLLNSNNGTISVYNTTGKLTYISVLS